MLSYFWVYFVLDINIKNNINLSLEQKLQQSIFENIQPKLMQTSNDNFRGILKEINFFEITVQLTENLKLLKTALSIIKPMSTQNERNFSISGHFVSKKQSRLSDKSIDYLWFLKSHFDREKIVL